MEAKFISYRKESYSEIETIIRSIEHLDYMNKRRTVRDFSSKPIPKQIIENIIMAASTAPSGAHKQPWTFCVVTNPELKSKIKAAAEEEEYESYNGRMPKDWLEDLSYLGTDWHKPFLENAPALIIVFKKSYDLINGQKRNNYYVTESVGLACGFLLEAIHYCGLVALTHTPSPMNFLIKLLERPENEKPFLLIPIGYPAENTMVPDLKRKVENEVIKFFK
ncbi:MAG: nitroreductase family protein [Bacteroidetes bacterium]|nr:nitroreductase family protein [Bacteroidota bacterium]